MIVYLFSFFINGLFVGSSALTPSRIVFLSSEETREEVKKMEGNRVGGTSRRRERGCVGKGEERGRGEAERVERNGGVGER